LTSTLLQRLLLLDLADLTLLGGVFLLFLLGCQEASSLPSDPIFRKWQSCFLNRRQILYTDLDQVSGRNSEAKDLKNARTTLTRGSNPWVGRIGTRSISYCQKLPSIRRARRATSSRGRDSCDILLPSNGASGVIWSSRSRRYVSGITLR
jgi:hypothetical protein